MEPNTKNDVSDEIKFNRFYANELLPWLKNIEKHRIKALFICFLSLIIAAVIQYYIIVFVLSTTNLYSNPAIVILKFVLMCSPLVFYLYILSSQINKYKKDVKNVILPKILDFKGLQNENFEFNAKLYVSQLKLFDVFNMYESDDIFRLRYNDISIDIAEIKLQREYGHGRHRNVKLIFDGILFRVPSFKTFNNITVIKKSVPVSRNIGEIVSLEDPDFMKNYYTFATDQIEARYLITPAFMQRMLRLNNDKLSLSFEENFINIAISSSKDWFDVSILRSALKKEVYKEIADEFEMIISIIDTLKLEQNIGM